MKKRKILLIVFIILSIGLLLKNPANLSFGVI